MVCSCGCQECSCGNRCVCDPDRCLCLTCYELRGKLCQMCGLCFSSPRENTVNVCACFLSLSNATLQNELPQNENRSSDDVSESAEELQNIFAELFDDCGNQRDRFRPIASSESSNYTYRITSSESSTSFYPITSSDSSTPTHPIASSESSIAGSESEVSEQVANTTETGGVSNYLGIRDSQNMTDNASTENLPLVLEENTCKISKVIDPSTTLESSNIATEERLEMSPRKRIRTQNLNVTKGMQEDMEASNFIFPPKRMNIEGGNDSTPLSNPASLSWSDGPTDVTKQKNTSFSEQDDSGASFSVSSYSKPHSSSIPTSASSTIRLQPVEKPKKSGIKAEPAPHTTATSNTTDSIRLPVTLLSCYQYCPGPPLDQNSSSSATIGTPFYRYLGIISSENTIAQQQQQTHSLTTDDSNAQQFTCIPNTPENINATPSTILPESPASETVAVTSHNQHTIHQCYNPDFCITQSIIVPQRPIALLPFPLTTPFPPFPSEISLCSTTTTPNIITGQEFQMPSIERPDTSSALQNPHPSDSVASAVGENACQLNPALSRVAHWVNTLPSNFDNDETDNLTENAKPHASGTSDERTNKSENDTHTESRTAAESDQSSDTEIYSMHEKEETEKN